MYVKSLVGFLKSTNLLLNNILVLVAANRAAAALPPFIEPLLDALGVKDMPARQGQVGFLLRLQGVEAHDAHRTPVVGGGRGWML